MLTVIMVLTPILLIIVIIVAKGIDSKIDEIRDKRVISASPYLQQIIALNKKYDFKPLKSKFDIDTFVLETKREYNRFKIEKEKQNYISNHLFYFKSIIEIIENNRTKFDEYKYELSNLTRAKDPNIVRKAGMSYKKFVMKETKLANDLKAKPDLKYTLKLQWKFYSFRKGYFSNFQTISYEEIKEIVLGRNSYFPKTKNNNFKGKNKTKFKIDIVPGLENIQF